MRCIRLSGCFKRFKVDGCVSHYDQVLPEFLSEGKILTTCAAIAQQTTVRCRIQVEQSRIGAA